ncbi:unnamed protein product [Effrenium voratum]|uniref:EF-hand domain-containing protein n=1 Tax=Effrenium voratum TaxID=2562239 RepID=A0AA36NLF9_9DINO|nr:unnamed protein product [Effrenium voratum]CAJ1456396.1 unnamed protein product [Effrenium voratum]
MLRSTAQGIPQVIHRALGLFKGAMAQVKYDAEIKKMCKQAISGSKNAEDQILEAFKSWDKDKNGFISKDELALVLSSLGCPTKPADLEAMLKEADLDCDGKVNYEEMVHWLCRAPHLEQYFLLSLDIFKRNFKDIDAEVLNVQREMIRLQEEYDERPEDQDETAAVKKCLEVIGKLLHKMDEVQKTTQKRIDDELTPVIKRSFKYHDKDNSGTLTQDEGIIFFSNFMALWEPFGELMSELNCAQVAMLDREDSEAEDLDDTKHLAMEKVKLVTPDKLHAAFKKKYAVLRAEHVKNRDQHQKDAWELLAGKDGMTEASVVEALLHGHEMNSQFLQAMGLRVEDVMKAAEPTCKMLQECVENIKQSDALQATMGEMDQAVKAMNSLVFDLDPAMPIVGDPAGDLGNCQMQ